MTEKKNFEIKYSEKAVRQLKKICKGDKKSARMIIEKIEEYSSNPHGNLDIKHLKGKFGILMRLRVGDYRIIFEKEETILSIYEIKHRQESYND